VRYPETAINPSLSAPIRMPYSGGEAVAIELSGLPGVEWEIDGMTKDLEAAFLAMGDLYALFYVKPINQGAQLPPGTVAEERIAQIRDLLVERRKAIRALTDDLKILGGRLNGQGAFVGNKVVG